LFGREDFELAKTKLYQFEALFLLFSFMHHVGTYPAMKKELMCVEQIYCQNAHI
jgi:hypothetical protein